MHLQLTFAAGGYDFVRPLADGTIKPDGIDLMVLSGMGSGERHHRMGHGQEFDLCEFNAAAYLAAHDRDYPWLALPVFLHRRFRHGFVFVNPQRGITSPRDLAGKRLGGPTFLAAGNVWMRGILEEHYGAPHHDITWFVEREDAVAFTPPPGLRYERVPEGVRAEAMMLDGKLDGLLSPDLPQAFLKGDPRIARLFAANKEEEIAYYKKTSIFPIMHVTLIKREIVERHPWVPNTLMNSIRPRKSPTSASLTRAMSRSPGCATRSRSRSPCLAPTRGSSGSPRRTAPTSQRSSAIAYSKASCARNALSRSCSSMQDG